MTAGKLAQGVVLNSLLEQYNALLDSIQSTPGWAPLVLNGKYAFDSIEHKEEQEAINNILEDLNSQFKDFLYGREQKIRLQFEQL